MDEQREINIEKKLDDVAELLKVLVSQQAEMMKISNPNITTEAPDDKDEIINEEEKIVEKHEKVEKPKYSSLVYGSSVDDTVNFLSGKGNIIKQRKENKENNEVIAPVEIDSPKKLEVVSEEVIEETKDNEFIPKDRTNLETFIGKNIFVILASLLVFIGVVFFAKTILPYFSEEIKFALMCIFSVGFTAFSYILVQKNKNNLTASMLACGLGTIYITLLTGNLYFKFINTIILYIALLFWIMIVYFCSKYKTIFFNIIGQAGILISLMLSIMNRSVLANKNLLLYTLIFTVIAEILYEFLFRQDEDYINIGCMLLSLAIMVFPVFNINAYTASGRITINTLITDRLLLLIVWAVLFLYTNARNILSNRNNQVKYSIISILSFLILILATNNFDYSAHKTIYIIHLVYLVVMFLTTEMLYYSKDRNPLLNLLSGISFTGVSILYYLIFDRPYISILILLLPIAYYMYCTYSTYPKKLFICNAVVATLLNLWNLSYQSFGRIFSYGITLDKHNIVYIISSVIIALICGYIIANNEEKHTYTMIGLYLFCIANIYMVIRYIISYNNKFTYLIVMALAVFIQFIFNYVIPLFEKTEKVHNQKSFAIYFIVNVFMSITAIMLLDDLSSSIPLYLIGSVFLMALFMFNSSVFLIEKNNTSAVYVGLKITALIFILLRPFNLSSIVSILLFIWAIACIILGQRFNQRHLRVYALILSLVSAVKLIMIDITYTSSLSRAFSFIICGLLCFLISFIYSKIEKSAKEDEEVI